MTFPSPGLVLVEGQASFSSNLGTGFAIGCLAAAKGKDVDEVSTPFDKWDPCCFSVGQLFELVGLGSVLGSVQWW